MSTCKPTTPYLLVFLLCFGCNRDQSKVRGWVDEARLLACDADNCCIVGLGSAENHYTTLDDLHDNNVQTLGSKWASAPVAGRVDVSPIVIDGTMFLSNNIGGIWAIDAGTGQVIWNVPATDSSEDSVRSDHGLAAWKGKIFSVSGKNTLVALDAQTGEMHWTVTSLDQINGTPQIGRDRIAITGLDSEGHSVVRAYRTDSGDEAWTQVLNTRNDETADDTPLFGSTLYDPQTGYFFIGSSGSVQAGDDEKESGVIASSSVVAIETETGDLAWQTVVGEGGATEPLMMADLIFNDARQQVIVQAQADGSIVLIDRNNGKLIATKQYNDKPSDFVEAISHNVRKELVHVLVKTNLDDTDESDWLLQAWEPASDFAPWRMDIDKPCVGMGLLSTSGNLIMMGDRDGYLNTYAAGDGKLIVRTNLGGSLTCPPVTYVVDGVQLVAAVIEHDSDTRVIGLGLGGSEVPNFAGANSEPSSLKNYPSRVKRKFRKLE